MWGQTTFASHPFSVYVLNKAATNPTNFMLFYHHLTKNMSLIVMKIVTNNETVIEF